MLENNATRKMLQNVIDGTTPPTFAETASALSRTSVVLAGNDSAKIGWWKIGEVTSETLTAITNFGGDYSAIFLLNGGAPMGATSPVAVSGMIELDGRVESGNFVLNNNQIKILKYISGNLINQYMGLCHIILTK